MDKDSTLALKIAITIVALLLVVAALWNYREAGRPVLVEVRVVSAVSGGETFRDGALVLDPGEEFQLAVALRLQEREAESYWVSPVPILMLEGEVVDHIRIDAWPEDDRMVRVHWFTIESSRLGGEVPTESAAELLSYRTFLAPDLGRGLLANGSLEPGNDNHVATDPSVIPLGCGTLRFYARVEVIQAASDVRSLQAASSLGPDLLWDPRLPVVRRRASAMAGLHASFGELFLLPGLAPAEDVEPGRLSQLEVSGRNLIQWVEARLAVTSWTFAAVASTGRPDLAPDALRPLGRLQLSPDRLLRNGRALRWGDEVRPGDLLAAGAHWLVIVADDGDGALDLDDTVAHCWRRPSRVMPLLAALDADVQELRHLRHDP